MKYAKWSMAMIAATWLCGADFSAAAVTSQWIGGSGSGKTWSTAGNWDNGIPNGIGDTANLNIDFTSNTTVNLNGAVTVGNMTAGNSGEAGGGGQTLTIAPGTGGSLILDNSGNGAVINRTPTGSGGVTFSSSIVLNDNLNFNVVTTPDLNPNVAFIALMTVSGNISETGGPRNVVKNGGSRLVLTGSSIAWSGSTTIFNGTLDFSGDLDTRTVGLTGNLSVDGGAIGGRGNFTRTLGAGAGQFQIGATDGGDNGFAAIGGEMHVTFSGGTPLVWGAGSFLTANGNLRLGSLVSNNTAFIHNDIDLGSGSGTRTISVAGSATIDGVVAGKITGSSSRNLTITGGGDAVLFSNDASTYAGKTTVSGGATLRFTSVGNVNGGPSSLGNPSSVVNGTITLGNTGNAGTIVYVGSGNSSTDRLVSLSGTTGGASINNSGTGTLAFTSTGDWTSGAGSKTLTLDGINTGVNLIAGRILNNSAANITSLVKNGVGTWNLSNTNNTYTGTTILNAGRLNVNGTHNGAGSYTVKNGATLGGSGVINFGSGASLIVETGGTVSPGNSPGALTVNGTAGFAAGSFLNMEIAGRSAGSEYDQLNISGAATLDGTLTVQLLNGFTPGFGEQFTLVNYGSKTGQFAAINGLTINSELFFQASYSATALTLIVKANHGDFNNDGNINAADINLLTAAFGSGGGVFDLDGNAAVNSGDLDYLLNNILHRRRGDSDLDGDVDTTDLAALRGHLGVALSGWQGGDFDGDGDVDASDLSLLRNNLGAAPPGLEAGFDGGFGFNLGAGGGSSVPEPGSIMLLATAMIALMRRR